MNHTISPSSPAWDGRDGRRITALRDIHFYNRCREILRHRGGRILTAGQLAAAAASSPAPCIYVSYIRALRVMYNYRRTGTLPCGGTVRQQMWRHIVTATGRRMARTGEPHNIALMNVLLSPAPSFFLNPHSALRLYHRLRSARRGEMFEKLTVNPLV